MAKDPAFLFYPSDWDGGTKLFTRAQKGAYIDLLMAQFHCGHMRGQEIRHVLGRDYDRMWNKKLKSKFKIDSEGLFYNEKLENEQIKRKKFTESRKLNIQGINQYTKNSGHKSEHMVNENKDISLIRIEEEKMIESIEQHLLKFWGRKGNIGWGAKQKFVDLVKKYSEKEVFDAIEKAADQNACSYSYVVGILEKHGKKSKPTNGKSDMETARETQRLFQEKK